MPLTLQASAQYRRKGEVQKGLHGWIKDYESRGWSKKKVALAAAIQAWLESYADIKMKKQLADVSRDPIAPCRALLRRTAPRRDPYPPCCATCGHAPPNTPHTPTLPPSTHPPLPDLPRACLCLRAPCAAPFPAYFPLGHPPLTRLPCLTPRPSPCHTAATDETRHVYDLQSLICNLYAVLR